MFNIFINICNIITDISKNNENNNKLYKKEFICTKSYEIHFY